MYLKLDTEQDIPSYLAVYLPGGSALREDDMVEVFVNSVQQPKEEFLGVVLGVTSELKGTLGHNVLRQRGAEFNK